MRPVDALRSAVDLQRYYAELITEAGNTTPTHQTNTVPRLNAFAVKRVTAAVAWLCLLLYGWGLSGGTTSKFSTYFDGSSMADILHHFSQDKLHVDTSSSSWDPTQGAAEIRDSDMSQGDGCVYNARARAYVCPVAEGVVTPHWRASTCMHCCSAEVCMRQSQLLKNNLTAGLVELRYVDGPYYEDELYYEDGSYEYDPRYDEETPSCKDVQKADELLGIVKELKAEYGSHPVTADALLKIGKKFEAEYSCQPEESPALNRHEYSIVVELLLRSLLPLGK